MKLLIAIVASALLLAFCTGCATPQRQILPPMGKEQIALEQARLVDAREVRNARWARIGETAGTMAINIAGSWLKAWLQPKEDGFRK